MAKIRGKYASPSQTERRKRILRETLKLLQHASPADISMAQIAELKTYSEVVPHLAPWEAVTDGDSDAAVMRTVVVMPPNSACVIQV